MIDGLTSALITAALSVINLFPESPFRPMINSFNDSVIHTYLSYVNYLLPISEMIGVLSFWLVGVSVYYIYQLVLRWVKVIE